MSRVTAIGLMSGTSYDGVDVALIETDGEEIGSLGPTGYRPYSDQERDLLRRAIAVATNLGDRTERPKILAAGRRARDRHACRGGGSVPGRERDGGERDRSGGFPRPDRPAPARPRPHGPDRQWAGARRPARAFPWSMTSAPPMSPPAGRARRSCRCSIAPWCASSSVRIRSACSISAASPTSPSSTATSSSSPSTPDPAMR